MKGEETDLRSRQEGIGEMQEDSAIGSRTEEAWKPEGGREGDTGGYRYDAFISYRHMPLDAAVATKLQALLEGYKPPKAMRKTAGRIRRIFRDSSELPTSSDLGKDIHSALRQSRYLIVICSEHLKASAWCMEEIRLFKEMHQGRTDKILTLLVSGEPRDVFPEALLWEERPTELSAGEETVRNVRIEPLCADVRAESAGGCLRRLKTEFLRIAAPLLGCGYDDLYQRHQRRKRKRRAAVLGSSVALLSLFLLVVSVFAYRTWVSEKNYKEILALNYTRIGDEYAISDKPQEALLYFLEAMETESEVSSAAAATVILLQRFAWPVVESTEQGYLQDGQVVLQKAVVYDADSGTCLVDGYEEDEIQDGEGNVLLRIEDGYTDLLDVRRGVWIFSRPRRFLIYDSAADQVYHMPWPEAYSVGIDREISDVLDVPPCAVALEGKKMLVAYRGMVYLCSLHEGDGSGGDGGGEGAAAFVLAQADLADVFLEEGLMQGISDYGSIYLSEDGSTAVVGNGSHTVVYGTEDLTLKGSVQQYRYLLGDVDFSADNAYYAAAYGNTYKEDYSNLGGYFAVYTKNGQCLFALPEKYRKAYLGVEFDKKDSDRILAWGRDFVETWDWKSGTMLSAPILNENIRTAALGADGEVLADFGDGTVRHFALRKPVFGGVPPEEALSDSGDIPKQSDAALGPDGISVLIRNQSVVLMDMEQAEVMDFVKIPRLVNKVAISEDNSRIWLYSTVTPKLLRVEVDFQDKTLGQPEEINTHGVMIQYVWSSGKWTAAETEEGTLMLFDDRGDYRDEIRSRSGGNTEFFLASPDGGRLAVAYNRTEGSTEDYHFYKSGSLEIWDVDAGLAMAAFEYEEDEITSAAVLPGGILAWTAGGDIYSCRMEIPVPDREALDFLKNLCCCVLDENQNIVYREPSDGGYRMGNWEEYAGDWVTEGASGQTDTGLAGERIRELSGASDKGGGEWFSECDALWRELLAGRISCGYMDLNVLYSTYKSAAVQAEDMGRIRQGLEAYIALMEGFIREDYKVYYSFTETLLGTAAETMEYDDIIGRAFCEAAEITRKELEGRELTYDENGDFNQDDYRQVIYNQQAYFWAEYASGWGSLLDAGDARPMDSAGKLGDTLIVPPLLIWEARVISALWAGDVERAVEEAHHYLAEIISMYSGDDDSHIQVAMWMRNLDALALRGLIEETVLESFLGEVGFDFGVKVTEVSPQAQQAGLQIGDMVLEKDGRRMISNVQQRQFGETEGMRNFTIFREGEILHIELPKGTSFSGEWYFRIR